MRAGDVLLLAWGALRAQRLRTRLTYGALAVGVMSVLLLSGLGEGARHWIEDRFTAIGSNVLILMPGRTETRGGIPMAAATTRDLTLEDARAVERRLPGVQRTAPLVVGEATALFEGRGRATTVVGSTRGYLEIRRIAPALGENLPPIEAERGARVCVIGHAIRRELFGTANPLGARIRLGDYPFRVVGVLAAEGQSLMVNLDETVIIPVGSAMRIFNRTGLFRMMVQLTAAADLPTARARLSAILQERHDGEEDFTLLTPGAVAAALGGIVRLVAAALTAIAAIALAVAGIGVMNVMVVAVTERTPEIGLMKALGASARQIQAAFLAEAALLSAIGGLLGAAAGLALTWTAGRIFPAIPFAVPPAALAAALATAVGVGLVFGLLPARRAANLAPLEALRRKG